MASVQSAPALPQGGAMIPPNLSQTQLQGMLDVCPACTEGSTFTLLLHEIHSDRSLTCLQKFKQMRAQGVSQEDPEFVRIHRTLMAVQKQKEFQKQSQIFAQQQAPQRQSQLPQQPNGSNGQPTANGVNGIISQDSCTRICADHCGRASISSGWRPQSSGCCRE